MMNRIAVGVSIFFLSFLAGPLLAQSQSDFPTKPIQFVVPYPAGGTSTIVSQVVSEKMAEFLGKPVVLVNKPGGGTAVGNVFVANAKPDGYTILLGAGALITLTLTMEKAPYKLSELTPIGRMTTGDFVLVAQKDVPANNLKDFVAYAKANKGKLSYAAGSSGSVPRLGAELFKDSAKFDAQYIPYASPSLSLPALLGGHVQYGLMEAYPAIPHIKSKAIKPLAIFSTKRIPELPDVPTFIELGYPDVVCYTYFILYAPAKTPPEVVKKLEVALEKTLHDKEVQKKLAKAESRADFLNSAKTKAFVDAEYKKWGDVIKKANINFNE